MSANASTWSLQDRSHNGQSPDLHVEDLYSREVRLLDVLTAARQVGCPAGRADLSRIT